MKPAKKQYEPWPFKFMRPGEHVIIELTATRPWRYSIQYALGYAGRLGWKVKVEHASITRKFPGEKPVVVEAMKVTRVE